MNALVGAGAGLLGASNATDEVYNINPTTAAVTNFKASLAPSAGDLAFAGGNLYESAVGAGGDELIDVTTGTLVGLLSLGATHFSGAFRLADNGTTMYAVNGTDIYSVNLSNADLTLVRDHSGHGLVAANGTAFLAESTGAVPEPSTWAMMLVGFAGLGYAAFRQRRRAPASVIA